VYERPPSSDISDRAFVDLSGGGNDSCEVVIAHREDDFAILDCVREVRPPLSPDDVVQEFAELLLKGAA
jgi:hypothetical protein